MRTAIVLSALAWLAAALDNGEGFVRNFFLAAAWARYPVFLLVEIRTRFPQLDSPGRRLTPGMGYNTWNDCLWWLT